MSDEVVHLFALGVRFLIDGESTDGRFSIVEHWLPPRGLGAPLHTHAHEDEFSFVLTGRLGAQLGDEIVEAGPGELVRKPRGQAHTFWNAGDEEVRFLEVISPGGFENYFREVAPVLEAHDQAAVMGVAARYQLEIDFGTIPLLAERHGLAAG